VTFTFRGTGVDWVTVRNRRQRRAAIYVYGVLVRTIDNYAATPTYGVVRSITGLVDGLHTVRIVVLGEADLRRRGRSSRSTASWSPPEGGEPLGRTVGFRVIRSPPGSLLLEGGIMANKDKGGSKSSKTAASKSLKEKRQAKKEKAARSGSSPMGTSTNK
jgi:hypothetical protein